MPDDTEQLVSAEDVARRFCVSVGTVNRWVRRGAIPCQLIHGIAGVGRVGGWGAASHRRFAVRAIAIAIRSPVRSAVNRCLNLIDLVITT